jgi:hypothetical protein
VAEPSEQRLNKIRAELRTRRLVPLSKHGKRSAAEVELASAITPVADDELDEADNDPLPTTA